MCTVVNGPAAAELAAVAGDGAPLAETTAGAEVGCDGLVAEGAGAGGLHATTSTTSAVPTNANR